MKLLEKVVRSVLFVPCDRLKVMEKAVTLTADVILFDLEDAVSPLNKEQSRNNVTNFVKSLNTVELKSKIVIRVNCPQTSIWGVDYIKSIRDLPIHAISLPKIENINSLQTNIDSIGNLKVWPMIETSKGVMNVESIASVNNVSSLVFGSNDLLKDLRAVDVPSRHPLIYSMSKCIVAARAYNKLVIDGVYMNLKDEVGYKSQLIQSKELGFDGKTLIHPNQINLANEIFSPSENDIIYAKRVIEAYQLCQKEGKGVTVLDGKLLELLHVHQAQELLHFHEVIMNK